MPVVSSTDSGICAQSRLQEVLSKIRKTPCNVDHSPASTSSACGTAKKSLVSSHTPTGYHQPEPVSVPVEKVQTPGLAAAAGHSTGFNGLTGEASTSQTSEDGCGPRYYSVMW